jgi:hypothetical protein
LYIMRSTWLIWLHTLGFVAPAVTLHLVERETGTQTVLLMQAERDDFHLKYMYEPPMTTLRLGFEGNPTNLNVITPPPGLDYEVQLKEQMALLKRGDLLVWLGPLGMVIGKPLLSGLSLMASNSSDTSRSKSLFMSDSTRFRFASLRDRGVKIVYYQSEPVNGCVTRSVDELWDYSWYNIDRCKREPNAPLQRYIPLAAVATPVTRQKDNPGALLYFGGFADRMPCWKYLKEKMGEQLQSEYGAWDVDAYERVLDTHNIYLNLHKRGCSDGGINPITWRNAKLLNAHALIISQRAYPKDEEEFEGLIDFVALKEIPERYRQLANMDTPVRQKIADERARLFSERFQARHIFERAGVYGNITRF